MKFIFCPVCSEENDDKSETCKACGRNLHPARSNNQIIDVHPSDVREVFDVDYKRSEELISPANSESAGVKGVLTFLCVVLIVFIPVMWIGPLREILLTDYGQASESTAFKNFQNYTKYTHILFAAISIYTGIAIMCKFKGAIGIAKFYWLSQPFLIALYNIGLFSMLNAINPNTTKGLAGEGIFQILSSIFWSGIWYAYLSNSKRVHATYELTGIRESFRAYNTDVFSVLLYSIVFISMLWIII